MSIRAPHPAFTRIFATTAVLETATVDRSYRVGSGGLSGADPVDGVTGADREGDEWAAAERMKVHDGVRAPGAMWLTVALRRRSAVSGCELGGTVTGG